ncbi:hypothetical protein DPX16_12764 [Anabarilius grahami]|uniref:Uncharacterized protein n=1 Tax=Anabarilius grahami TaxID=495550 RepID=A0A3N0Z8W7_ANAGA|nr:hypothetical protein DPX16_12764 [Anabarilius grahami]
MAIQEALDRDESIPDLDFSSAPFSTHREPLRELINMFSDLYLDSEEENEEVIMVNSPRDVQFLPPPPPEIYEEPTHNPFTNISAMLEQLTECFTKLEERITYISKRVSEQDSFTDFESQRKATEEKLSYRIDRECSRLRKLLELRIQDLGQSVLDCLKRRDQQLDHRLQAFRLSISTPIQLMNTNTVTNSSKRSNLQSSV